MDPREVPISTGGNGERVRLVLTLSVENSFGLWDAAAKRAIDGGRLTLDDVVETIGPRDDPRVADCIAMLAVPPNLEGCALEDVSITAHSLRSAPDNRSIATGSTLRN